MPVVFNTVNKSLPTDSKVWTESFRSWVCVPRAALPLESRLPGKNTMCFFAASGRPIKIDAALRSELLSRRLQAVLDVYAKLPAAERSPAEARTRPDLSKLKYSSGGGRYVGEEPPTGRLVLRAYSRILTRDKEGSYRVARLSQTQFMTEDTSFYEGAPRFKAEGSSMQAPRTSRKGTGWRCHSQQAGACFSMAATTGGRSKHWSAFGGQSQSSRAT